MRQRSLRRPSAWLALVAMLAALALPVHAMPSRVATAGVGGDLCVGGKIVPGSPAWAGAAQGCDACCGSTASAPPRSATARASAFPTVVMRAAPARAPPA